MMNNFGPFFTEEKKWIKVEITEKRRRSVARGSDIEKSVKSVDVKGLSNEQSISDYRRPKGKVLTLITPVQRFVVTACRVFDAFQQKKDGN